MKKEEEEETSATWDPSRRQATPRKWSTGTGTVAITMYTLEIINTADFQRTDLMHDLFAERLADTMGSGWKWKAGIGRGECLK